MSKGHRSKLKRIRNNNMKIIKPFAKISYANISVQKACYVLNAIRGKNIFIAIAILTYNTRYASKIIKKLLESAIANAKNNSHMIIKKLYISKCYANSGSIIKRNKPRAQGRTYKIEKRNCHIIIILDEK